MALHQRAQLATKNVSSAVAHLVGMAVRSMMLDENTLLQQSFLNYHNILESSRPQLQNLACATAKCGDVNLSAVKFDIAHTFLVVLICSRKTTGLILFRVHRPNSLGHQTIASGGVEISFLNSSQELCRSS